MAGNRPSAKYLIVRTNKIQKIEYGVILSIGVNRRQQSSPTLTTEECPS
jgi:hypothetical protein